jgi:hypothetical protein
MGKILINQNSLKTSREWKRHKVQDGSNVYRILPPFGDVEVHNNYPYRKWSVAWLVDPKRGSRMPFATPLTDGEENCPVKEYQEALRKFIENKKAMLQAEGVSDLQIKDLMKTLHDVQWNVKVQHMYAYNACDKSGNVGLLEIKSTAHKAMKKKMSEYIEKYGQDPTSLNSDLKEDSGVWFNIKKDGIGKNTEYSVDFATTQSKDSDGDIVFKSDRTPLPEQVVEGYADQGYDLNSIYRRKDYDELKEILAHNLTLIAEDCPEALLPGFGASQVNFAEESNDEPVTKAVTAKRPVNLNLSDDEDTVTTTASTSSSTVTAAGSDMDDIKNFADSILGD